MYKDAIAVSRTYFFCVCIFYAFDPQDTHDACQALLHDAHKHGLSFAVLHGDCAVFRKGTAKQLRSLSMSNNQFTGTLPSSWAEIPTLARVYLSDNQLTGALPSQWKSKSLTDLMLSNNQFSGPVAAWAAPNLFRYVLGEYANGGGCEGNKVSGQIPSELGKLMPRLKVLKLQCNNLSGTLPPELGHLSQLTSLDVSFNKALGGTLPSSLGKLSKLEILRMSDTSIRGGVPETFAGLTELKTLNVDNTQLSGCIPSNMAGIKGVVSSMGLTVRSTRLTGFCG